MFLKMMGVTNVLEEESESTEEEKTKNTPYVIWGFFLIVFYFVVGLCLDSAGIGVFLHGLQFT